jgi:hypothetical protein
MALIMVSTLAKFGGEFSLGVNWPKAERGARRPYKTRIVPCRCEAAGREAAVQQFWKELRTQDTRRVSGLFSAAETEERLK